MTSQIDFNAIDITYPVAGQDNNSQGFRGNFAAIQTGLSVAKTEITDLQNNTAKKNAASNDFGGNTITNALYNKFYGQVFPATNASSSATEISLNNGPLQTVAFSVDGRSMKFKDWPESLRYAVIRVHLYSTNTSEDIDITIQANGGRFVVEDGVDVNVAGTEVTFTLGMDGRHQVIEVWTYSGSDSTPKLFLKHLGEF